MTGAADTWDPKLYLAFADERTRPARDLLARVPIERPRRAVDVGCGPGNSTELLVERFPAAIVSGFDTSARMIDEARLRVPTARFSIADAAAWTPDAPVDLIFANAVFHWVPDHATLIPRLVRALDPGGVLAVQMPDNLDEPSHRLMREVAARPRYAAHIGAVRRDELLTPEAYVDLLSPLCDHVDVFRTTYHHRLADAGAIVSWVSGTGLRPFVDALPETERAPYLADYEAAIARAYPTRPGGGVLFPFPRLFIIGRRHGS